jgi:hypothetical protein
MEVSIIKTYISKDHTLDYEFIGLTKKMNYTDQSIHVGQSKSEIVRQRPTDREENRAGDHKWHCGDSCSRL